MMMSQSPINSQLLLVLLSSPTSGTFPILIHTDLHYKEKYGGEIDAAILKDAPMYTLVQFTDLNI